MQKIDDLIELFELKETDYKLLTARGHNDFINDFDRLFSTITKIQCNFVACQIEDFKNESSAFYPAREYLKIIYSCICQDEVGTHYDKIQQFTRLKNPSSNNLIQMHSFTRENLLSYNNNEKYLAFLSELDLKLTTTQNIKDNLTLFFVTMLIWNEWMTTKGLDAMQSSMYTESIICNCVLIIIKKALDRKNEKDDKQTSMESQISLTYADMVNYVAKKLNENEHDMRAVVDMVKTYEDVCNEMHDFLSLDLDTYFKKDIPAIHRISVSFSSELI